MAPPYPEPAQATRQACEGMSGAPKSWLASRMDSCASMRAITAASGSGLAFVRSSKTENICPSQDDEPKQRQDLTLFPLMCNLVH